MIYNLLIATILIVAFFICYKTMGKLGEKYQEDIFGLRLKTNDLINQIETLRSESLESYRKGLYDGLEIKKDNILVVEPKPVKTFEELKEITENKKEFKVKEEEMKTIVDDYWK